jgi:uncharacterized membrane protein
MREFDYAELKKVKARRLKRLSLYSLLVFMSMLALSYVISGDLDSILSSISEVSIFRSLCILGTTASALFFWYGEKLEHKLEEITNTFRGRKEDGELVEVAKTFEKFMKGEWE